MRPQDLPPRISRLRQLSNGLQKEQADIIRTGGPFTRPEQEQYLEGVRLAINGLDRAALSLEQVVRRLENDGGRSGGAVAT